MATIKLFLKTTIYTSVISAVALLSYLICSQILGGGAHFGEGLVNALTQKAEDYGDPSGTPQLHVTTEALHVIKHIRKHRGNKTLYPLTLSSPYLINSPNLCKNATNLMYVTIVHTATTHFTRRRIIRETWANTGLFRNISTRIVFVFGLTKDKNVQALLENEQVINGDIIQGDFLDHYHNLTHKGVLALRWVSEYCNNSRIIVKVDDDIFMNPFLLLQNILPKYENKKRFILCRSRRPGTAFIFRGKWQKWSVHKDEFKGYGFYPHQDCMGFFVIISADIIESLYQAAYLAPFFWIDDVYLFGILPSKIGNVTHTDIRDTFTGITHGKKCYTNPQSCNAMVIMAHNLEETKEVWINIMKHLTNEQKSMINDDYLLKLHIR
ncbi:hypothetical protein SNE40_002327 [Patella caerulea]|uniref:Hexosyltransferase n=1 Tax=Patella caerulea TaxID=87958 RepID=A0AAN8JS04_PATCE